MADATQAAADTAQKIGAALIGAAGLAAQRFFGLADDQVVASNTTKEASKATVAEKADDEPTLEFPAQDDAPAVAASPAVEAAPVKKPGRTAAVKSPAAKMPTDNNNG